MNCLKAQKAAASSPLNFGRIAKPLRGGGGVAPPAAPVPISGGALGRLQNEEAGYVISLFSCGSGHEFVFYPFY